MYTGHMAQRQFHLTQDEQQALRLAEEQTRDARELRHFQGVRLYGSGTRLHTILNLLGCGESTLREWIRKYQQSGIEGLHNGWDGKNANKLSEMQRADLRERLHASRPEEVLPAPRRIDDGPFWTVNDLRLAVEIWYGVTYALYAACSVAVASAITRWRRSTNRVPVRSMLPILKRYLKKSDGLSADAPTGSHRDSRSDAGLFASQPQTSMVSGRTDTDHAGFSTARLGGILWCVRSHEWARNRALDAQDDRSKHSTFP